MTWTGPYGINIDDCIDSVVAEDGYNILSKNGDLTTRCSTMTMNEEMFKEKYAEQNVFGDWYYVPNKKVGYWIGPYRVYVPNHITRVKAHDGCNILSKDGCLTAMFSTIKMNEQIYKEKYAVLVDSEYFYKV